MNILMMSNTYKPLVGGLEKSVEAFTREFRKAGHRVVIVAPKFDGMKPEKDVVRIPAVQHFNGSDFSIQLPIPGVLAQALGNFKPDIVHSHHPFFIGDTALRVAFKYNVPLIFTHHTLYEENVHYVPGNQDALRRFVIELATGYANLSDQVFAPSESILQLMRARGVETSVEVVPTGVYLNRLRRGSGKAFRALHRIPPEAFVVGYVGRLAPEKNLEFLSRCIVQFLKKEPRAHYLVCGQGPLQEVVRNIAAQHRVADRVHFGGILAGLQLSAAYHAMDVFAFASQSETQGLVVTEAMASGTPVVAVDAPGVRDVVKDQFNGRLLDHESMEDFISALEWMQKQSPIQIKAMKKNCRQAAENVSMEHCARKALKKYEELSLLKGFVRRPSEDSRWAVTARLIHAQWELVKNLTKAAGAML